MDRREFLITSGGAAAAAVATTGPAAGQASSAPESAGVTRTLTLAMPWPDNAKGYANSAHRLARLIEQHSNGRYRIVNAAPGASSEADLVYAPAYRLSNRHPAVAYFAGLPGTLGLAPEDIRTWLSTAGGQMLWDELSEQLGWKSLLAGHSGNPVPLWSRKPIASISDLQSLKLYAPGLAGTVATGLGADTVTIADNEVPEAFAKGTLDAVEWGSVVASMAIGIPAHAQYALLGGIAPAGTSLALDIRRSTWNELPVDDQALFTAAAAEEFQNCLAEWRTHNALVKTTLQNSLGVTFVATPTDIIEARNRIAEATVAHIAGSDELSTKIDRSYMAFRNSVMEANAMS